MIEAACAVITRGSKIFCAQRSEKARHPLLWEFPGGKLEEGETPEECVVREIMEELRIEVVVKRPLSSNIFDYGNGYVVRLYPFVCELVSGEPILTEHRRYKWLTPDALSELDWVEGDLPIIALLSSSGLVSTLKR